jgi:hypothetical protein
VAQPFQAVGTGVFLCNVNHCPLCEPNAAPPDGAVSRNATVSTHDGAVRFDMRMDKCGESVQPGTRVPIIYQFRIGRSRRDPEEATTAIPMYIGTTQRRRGSERNSNSERGRFFFYFFFSLTL